MQTADILKYQVIFITRALYLMVKGRSGLKDGEEA